MSLNRTLDRFLSEIRREAKRNPAFAERMDAVFRAHHSGRDVSEDVAADVAENPEVPALPLEAPAKAAVEPLPNPVGLLQKEGEEGLRAAFSAKSVSKEMLLAAVAEHNLDPTGSAEGASIKELVDLIVVAAKRRIERDKKLFDY
jgi:hypothetical protein